jgi:hypothetical protein
MAAQKESPRREVHPRGDQKATTTNRSYSSQSTPLELLQQRLERLRYRGDGKWAACCPAHDDSDPSLSIRECGDGTILLHDFGGCATPEILAAIGLEFRDLFPQSPGRSNGARRSGLSPKRRRELEEALENERLIVRIVEADLRAKRATRSDVEKAGGSLERIWKIRGLLRNG